MNEVAAADPELQRLRKEIHGNVEVSLHLVRGVLIE